MDATRVSGIVRWSPLLLALLCLMLHAPTWGEERAVAPSRAVSKARAEQLVREAEQLWRLGRASDAAEKLAVALQLDGANPHVYRLQAQMARAAGREDLELQAWKRLVETARADLPLRRQAKGRIAELYRLLDGNRPEWEYRLPPPPPPDADLGALAGGVWRVLLKPSSPTESRQTGELRFTVSREHAGWWLQGVIDTRGLEVSASLERRQGGQWQTVWRVPTAEPQPFPRLECSLSPGEYRLRVAHEGARDGVEGEFHLALCLSLSQGKPAPPMQGWTYRLRTDGSAEVEATVSGGVVLPVPFTAEALQVEGARYSLLPPVYEYLSRTPLRQAQVLLVQPTGERATVRFRWLDAAYDMPTTALDRRARFRFRSLAALGTTRGEMEVHVQLPEGTGEIVALEPAPLSREGSLLRFRLSQDAAATVSAENAQMDTRWLTASYRRLTVYLPDTPFYRRWLPEYLAQLMRLYDRERRAAGGEARGEMQLIALPLSEGEMTEQGGAQADTWFTSTQRITPYALRYAAEGNGTEAQAIREMFRRGVGEALSE